MLSQLTYTTEFLPLFNIDDQCRNNSGQMFSAQWDVPDIILPCPDYVKNAFKSLKILLIGNQVPSLHDILGSNKVSFLKLCKAHLCDILVSKAKTTVEA